MDANKWLTPEHRRLLKEKEDKLREDRHGSRLNKKYTFDFAGRRVVDDDIAAAASQYDPSKDETLKKILEAKDQLRLEKHLKSIGQPGPSDADLVNPSIQVARPVYVQSATSGSVLKTSATENSSTSNPPRLRIQVRP